MSKKAASLHNKVRERLSVSKVKKPLPIEGFLVRELKLRVNGEFWNQRGGQASGRP